MGRKLFAQIKVFIYPMSAICVDVFNGCKFTIGKNLKNLRCSSRNVECSFGNRSEKFWLKVRSINTCRFESTEKNLQKNI